MELKEQLKAVRELLTPPENWTQGSNARDKSGEPVYATAKEATCWCLWGAWEKVQRSPVTLEAMMSESGKDFAYRDRLLDAAAKLGLSNVHTVSDVNDFHPHETVLKVLTLAEELS